MKRLLSRLVSCVGSLTVRGLILVIRVYQLAFSPLLGQNCRFYPVCSVYGMQALRKHGVIKGCALITWRLLRCQPFCQGGHDPVP